MTKKKPYLFIKVLQNGFPVCSAHQAFGTNKTIYLSTHRGPLQLPFYPFYEDMEVVRVRRQGFVEITCKSAYSGSIITSENSYQFNVPKINQEKIKLYPGDYASIHIKDLTLLIKIEAQKPKKKIKQNKLFKPRLSSLFFLGSYEKKTLMISALLTFLLMGSFILWAALKPPDPRKKFEDLMQTYTLPFMNPDALKTIPEAVKENLDRTDFISTTIRFYRQITFLFTGAPLIEPALLYPSSIAMFAASQNEKKFALEKAIETRKKIDQKLSKDMHLAVPGILMQSLQQQLVELLLRTEKMQMIYNQSLDLRRLISDHFRDDPLYDWNNYNKLDKRGAKKGNEELSKIKVFGELTNEQNMYFEVDQLALKTERLAPSYEQNKETVWLNADTVDTVTIQADSPALTFLSPEDLIFPDLTAKELDDLTNKTLLNGILPKFMVNSLQKDADSCYHSAFKRDPWLKGELTWSWNISREGKVSDLKLVRNTIRNKSMISCMQEKIKRCKFPPSHEEISYQHNFNFNSRTHR